MKNKFKEAFDNLNQTINKYEVVSMLYRIEEIEDISFETQLWIKGHNMQLSRAIKKLLEHGEHCMPENVKYSMEYLAHAYQESADKVPNPFLFATLKNNLNKIISYNWRNS